MNTNANWDDLRVFLTRPREGTLTTAAKALGVSHPTVARRVGARRVRYALDGARDGALRALQGGGARHSVIGTTRRVAVQPRAR